jgi:hypothetical protein
VSVVSVEDHRVEQEVVAEADSEGALCFS